MSTPQNSQSDAVAIGSVATNSPEVDKGSVNASTPEHCDSKASTQEAQYPVEDEQTTSASTPPVQIVPFPPYDYRPRAIPSRVVLRARLAQLECELSGIPRDRTLGDMVADKTLVVLDDLILATEDLGKDVEQYAEVHHIRAAIQWHLSTMRDVLDPSDAHREACEEAAQESALAYGRFNKLQFSGLELGSAKRQLEPYQPQIARHRYERKRDREEHRAQREQGTPDETEEWTPKIELGTSDSEQPGSKRPRVTRRKKKGKIIQLE
ncbi:hypothetical protein B0O80DRAFT_514574 [Mortierella sp. GBAus27b]|nr:hypothetical protein BGX31_002127 [Mortierella sp. GBA43]KAI8348625.1 hypothetical protein B0O80DRAFT_514574 [Mortierella sp. GBAus27b]